MGENTQCERERGRGKETDDRDEIDEEDTMEQIPSAASTQDHRSLASCPSLLSFSSSSPPFLVPTCEIFEICC